MLEDLKGRFIQTVAAVFPIRLHHQQRVQLLNCVDKSPHVTACHFVWRKGVWVRRAVSASVYSPSLTLPRYPSSHLPARNLSGILPKNRFPLFLQPLLGIFSLAAFTNLLCRPFSTTLKFIETSSSPRDQSPFLGADIYNVKKCCYPFGCIPRQNIIQRSGCHLGPPLLQLHFNKNVLY